MSGIRSLKKNSFEDKETSKLQENLDQWTQTIIGKQVINGLVLRSVSLSTGSNEVNHLLGRTLVGWQIVRQRAAATVYDEQDANPMPSKTLRLNSSAPVTIDLWVF